MCALFQIGSGAIGQPGAEDVLHGCHGQEVVDAEHLLLCEHLREKRVQLGRFREILTERLFQHDRASVPQPGTVQRGDCGGENERREREVGGDRLSSGNDGGQGGRIGDVCPVVLRRREDRISGRRGKRPRVLVELGACPIAKFLVTPVLPADRDE